MPTDRRLGSYFWAHEFPCWEKTTEADLDVLQGTVRELMDPTRRRWGRLDPTSWMHHRAGCRKRTGAHVHPGTVDFIATQHMRELGVENPLQGWADMSEEDRRRTEDAHQEVGRWMATYLPATAYGQIIDERSHIHITRPGVGGRPGDSPTGMALREPEEGKYVFMMTGTPAPGDPGSYGDPIWLPGIDVTVAGPGGLLAWLIFGVLVGAAFVPQRGR